MSRHAAPAADWRPDPSAGGDGALHGKVDPASHDWVGTSPDAAAATSGARPPAEPKPNPNPAAAVRINALKKVRVFIIDLAMRSCS